MWLGVLGAVLAVLFLLGFGAHLHAEAQKERAEREENERAWRAKDVR